MFDSKSITFAANNNYIIRIMKSKRLITMGLAMLTVMSVFATNNADAQDAVSTLLGGTISLITFIIFAVLYFIWYFFVAIMARKRNRSVVLWIFFSILGTPLLMMLILLCIGKDESAYDRYNN